VEGSEGGSKSEKPPHLEKGARVEWIGDGGIGSSMAVWSLSFG
jgi:hypothetical protein